MNFDVSRPIGILDSGVGGFKIFSELLNLLPKENFIYYCDNINNPYGSKSEIFIREAVTKATSKLLDMKCKLLVLACNTASVTSLEHLRSLYNIPIVGVVPVIKVLGEGPSENVGILGTKITLKGDYIKWLIDTYAKHKNVIKIPLNQLVTIIEEGNFKLLDKELEKISIILKKEKISILGLGCTHYTLIKNEMKCYLKNVNILDSNKAVALQVQRVLKKNILENTFPPKFKKILYNKYSNQIPFWSKQIGLDKQIGSINKISNFS